jgi:phosphoribosylglycinamide formyltransferase-1
MRVVILGSGRGSNAEALLRAEREGRLGCAQVVAIFSDRPDARILELARSFGKPGHFVDPGPFKTKFSPEREAAWVEAIRAERPDLVVLAGFMRVIKEPILTAFAGRIINLHPSLLPSFPGLDGIGQAWRRGVKVTGCTVHVVTAEVDGGPILDQAAVRIETSDTLESLERKIHAAEHALLPAVVARLSSEGLPTGAGHAR